MDKKSQAAMGSLMIFIALIITAAVAAVIITLNMSSLQGSAIGTGKEVTKEVGGNLDLVEAYGTRDGTANTVSNLTLTVRLSPGAEKINLQNLLVTLHLDERKDNYFYNSSNFTTRYFTVTYPIEGSAHSDGSIVSGDVAQMLLISNVALTESKTIKVEFVPREGTPRSFYINMPDAIKTAKVPLYP